MATKPGTFLEIGISEPAEFFIEAGAGPYYGIVTTADTEQIGIRFEKPLQYRGAVIQTCIAKPRYEEDSLSAWDGSDVRIVNLVLDVSVPGITHLIGDIRHAPHDNQ
jgi:hypothetical protein